MVFFSVAVLKYSKTFSGQLKPGSLSYRSNSRFRLVVNILKLKILFFWYWNLGQGHCFTTRKTKLTLRYFVYTFLYPTVMNTFYSSTNKPKANGYILKSRHISITLRARAAPSQLSLKVQGVRCKKSAGTETEYRVYSLSFLHDCLNGLNKQWLSRKPAANLSHLGARKGQIMSCTVFILWQRLKMQLWTFKICVK